MSEGEQLLNAHLAGARFLAGAARGRWRLLRLEWPLLHVEVSARDGRAFCLQFDCTGYPEQPPTSMPWDMALQAMLEPSRWPRGGRVGQVFRPDWKGGIALYLPCDRQSIEGHPNWYTEYPSLIWSPSRGVVQYLEIVHELLQSHELVAETA